MIVSWFTQPPGSSFSSYYQYDTVTKQFSRVRLELGRSGADGGGTFASYYSNRAVGFNKGSVAKGGTWTVNSGGELCYNGKALPGPPPQPGDKVYDTSDPTSFVHSGNPVAAKGNLPPDIKPEHLALLANDAMVNKAKISLTAGTATAGELSAKIKVEVVRILGVKDFASATPELILTKLTSQADIICGKATSQSAASVEKALGTAKDSTALVTEQIDAGVLTPTPELETAVSSLDSALTSAQTATKGGDQPQALAELSKAGDSVTTAIKNIDTAKYESAATQLETAKTSVTQAEQGVTDIQALEKEYSGLSKADSVDKYMSDMDTLSDAEG